MGDQTSVPGNFPQWAMEKSSRKGSNAWIPHTVRNSSKFRNPQTWPCWIPRCKHLLPATTNSARRVPGNYLQRGDGRISSQSHKICLIVVDLGVREGDSCSIDVNTTSLPKHIPQQKVPGNYLQGRDGETFKERFNLDAISLQPVEYGGTHRSSRKLPAMGRWKTVPGNGSNLEASHVVLRTREIHVSSRKLPAIGRWRNVPRKVQRRGSSQIVLYLSKLHSPPT